MEERVANRIIERHQEPIYVLIDTLFKQERIYFNTAEDIQIVPLKRYLYHQSTIRNRWNNALLSMIQDYDIALDQCWVEKGHVYRSAKEDQEFLENRNYSTAVERCLDGDIKLLQCLDTVLTINSLPVEVLEVAVIIKTELLFEISESEDLILEIMKNNEKSGEREKGKLIALHKNSSS